MNKATKTSLSVALAATMAAGAIPALAFADEATAQPQAAAEQNLAATAAAGAIATVGGKPVNSLEEMVYEIQVSHTNPVWVNLNQDLVLPSGFELPGGFAGPTAQIAFDGKGHTLSVAGKEAGTMVLNGTNLTFKDITLDMGNDTLLVKPAAYTSIFLLDPTIKGNLGKIEVADAGGQVMIEDQGDDALTLGGVTGAQSADGVRNTFVKLNNFGESAENPYTVSGFENVGGVLLSDSNIRIDGDATGLGTVLFETGSNATVTVNGAGKLNGMLQIPTGSDAGKHEVILENGATLELDNPVGVPGEATALDVVVKGELPAKGALVTFADKSKAPTLSFVDAEGAALDRVVVDENGNYVVTPLPAPGPEQGGDNGTGNGNGNGNGTENQNGNNGTEQNQSQSQQNSQNNGSSNNAGTDKLPQTGDASATVALGATGVGLAGLIAAAAGMFLRRRNNL